DTARLPPGSRYREAAARQPIPRGCRQAADTARLPPGSRYREAAPAADTATISRAAGFDV
ncbi:MAG: hypothetical protein ACQEVA_01885, partial [Myxococcota bacterium]